MNSDKDNNKINKKKINLNEILIDTINENKIVYLSSATLATSLIMSVIVFPAMYSDFVAKFPDKLINVNYNEIIVLLSPFLISEITAYISDSIDSYTLPKIENDIITKLINKTIKSVKTTKKELNANELVLTLKKIFDIRDLYRLICAYVLPAIAVSIGLIYYFIKADKKYGIIIAIILAITFVSLIMMGNNCFNSAQRNEEDINLFYDDVHDMLNNVEHVIVSGMENKEEIRMIDNQSEVINSNVRNDCCNTNLKFTFTITYFFVMLIANGLAMKLYQDEKIDKTVIVTIFFMVSSLIGMYDGMVYELRNITNTIGSYNEIYRYFEQFEIDENPTLDNFPIGIGKIQFTNINLKYGEKQIFNNFNLTVNSNTITGIMGEIGSGKSTLLKMLVGLIDYDGIITIDDVDISKYDSMAISKHLAYIPQNPKLFNRTILENLNYGSNYCEDDIWKIIKFYDLEDFFNSFKHKLHTNVGKNGEKISGGQRQLIYILRSFVQNKKIFLFDEPSSALDIQHTNILIKLLQKVKNRTMIIVTHDNELKKVFDRTLVIDKGNVVEDN